MTQEKGPYRFQRDRQRLNSQPRPSQPNTRQPNQKYRSAAWGMTTVDYWDSVFDDYLKRRRG